MAGNIDPIYGRVYRNPRVALTTGNNTTTGADATLLFTADATNGSRLQRLLVMPVGSNVATLLRIFIATAGANFRLLRDFPMPAYTLSATNGAFPVDIPLPLGLAPGEQIYVQLATAVAGGIHITAEAMDF